MDDSETFSGFPREGLEFLTVLGTKDKAWFDRNRSTYDRAVVGPTKAFVTALGERLADEISPGIVAQPKTNGSIAPINNDLRFSPDRAPYKDHLLLKFWDGENKKTAPTLWVRISETDVGFASGAPFPSVERWRELVADESTGAQLDAILTELGRGRKLDIAGRDYKRVPNPYDENHPRADLLRHKNAIQARWPEPTPASVTRASFVDWCMRRLTACADLHHWFTANL
ncbi:MAG: DUF2461 domain-containing protein [Acidimicrobiia bacterium]|nr:DUF2461 domain-containing protein [Acidimicrobiia bacterium]